jgi:hypothetical protein
VPALPFTYPGSEGPLSAAQRTFGARYVRFSRDLLENGPEGRFAALPQHWFPALQLVHVHGSRYGGHDRLPDLTVAFDEHGAGRIVTSVVEVDAAGTVEVVHGIRLCTDDALTACEDLTAELVTALRAERDTSSPEALVSELLRVLIPIVGASGEGRVVRSAEDLPSGELRWITHPPPEPSPPIITSSPLTLDAEGLVVLPRSLGGAAISHFELELGEALSLTLRPVGHLVIYLE